MKEIVRILKSETSEAMEREFLDEKNGVVARMVLTMKPRSKLRAR